MCLGQVLNLLANVPEEETSKASKRSQPVTVVTEPPVKKLKSETSPHTPTINEKDIQMRSNYSLDSES